jgi:para-nitrobenzyl esterase
LFAALLAGCSPAPPSAPQAITDATVYSGVWSGDRNIAAFLGVPFARPPLAALRWAPPETPVVPAEMRADHFAPACMQGEHLVQWYRKLIADFGGDPATFDGPEISEDCLYLNIWAPQPETIKGLPVMVWIHGGSNKSGWSYEPNYLGEALAGKGVVVVSIAYRLGVFGFFAHPELGMSNFGLLDQVEALRWLQRNIEYFGGDPDNVTIFGESAGADDIGSLIVSPLARGLFRRAIHQSGGSGVMIRDSAADLAPLGLALSQQLGGDGTLASLRDASAESVLLASEKTYAGHYFDPVIDEDSLLEPPLQTLAKANLPPIDLIIGTNANEWLMYLDDDAGDKQLTDWLAENAHGDGQKLKSIVPDSMTARQKLDRLSTALDFACPSLLLADAVHRAGGNARVYYFSRRREGALGAAMGAYHGAEIPYIFDTHDSWLPTTAADRALTTTMSEYWTSFAKTGTPTTAWPLFQFTDFATEQLDEPLARVRHPDAGLCPILLPKAGWGGNDE